MSNVRTPIGVVCLLLLAAVGSADELLPLSRPTPGTVHVIDRDPPLKDLTPEGFEDLVPHDDHAVLIPGHLAPLVPDGRGFFVNADYFLMRTRADGQNFAINSRSGGLATDGPVFDLRYRFGSGFRTELGYRLPDGGLNFSAAYTFFRATGHSTLGAAPGRVLLPTLTRPGLIDTASTAVASSLLEYDVYDALVGRRFALDDHLAVRAFGGVRFADIAQRFDVRYDGRDARTADVRHRSRFQGTGPLLGGEAVYAGTRGFHLYARGSGGLLSGFDRECRRETNDSGRTLYSDTPFTVRKVVPVASLGVGVGFQYRTLSLRVGYEATHWFGLTDRIRFPSDVSQGAFVTQPANLSVDGLFMQLGLAF